jgi:hypothetical protein
MVLGSVYKGISESIANQNPDLIVMGSKGASGLDEVIVGSNTEKVVRTAACPVITIKAETDVSKMKKVVKLTESDIEGIVKRVLNEKKTQRYMFFSNLEQMKRQCEILLDMEHDIVEGILDGGHDWAQDHIAEAKNNMDQVFDFLMNEINGNDVSSAELDDVTSMMNEGKKKNVATNQTLWKQSLAWAKRTYDVCPSAYCNGAAVKRYNSKGGKWKKI